MILSLRFHVCNLHEQGVVPAHHSHGSRPGPHLREHADGGRVCASQDTRLQVPRALLTSSGTAQQAGGIQTCSPCALATRSLALETRTAVKCAQ